MAVLSILSFEMASNVDQFDQLIRFSDEFVASVLVVVKCVKNFLALRPRVRPDMPKTTVR